MVYMPVVQRYAPAENQALAKRADVLTSERLCMGLSMFRKALSRIKVGMLAFTFVARGRYQGQAEILTSRFDAQAELTECDKSSPVWHGPPPINGITDVDECNRFHRLWSAIQYITLVEASRRGNDQTLWVFK